MQMVFLLAAILVIIVLLACKRPLHQALLGGLATLAVLYRIPPIKILQMCGRVLTQWSSLSVLLTFYLVALLQRILEARKQIRLAQEDLDKLCHNRRVNTAGAAVFIGLLPSAAAMILCSDIIKSASDGYLDSREQACTASWFRHIPESALPTYTGVLLMLNLAGVSASGFLAGMLVPLAALAAIGYGFYLRRIPRQPQGMVQKGGLGDVWSLIRHLWTLLLILVLILGFDFQVVTAILISIAGAVAVYRVTAGEMASFCRNAFEKKLLGNTYLVLALKEFIDYTGALESLPELMSGMTLPPFLVFGLLIFVATIISGTTGAIAMGTPLAFAAIPNGGIPLAVYLMCMCHAGSQVSPTHICLVVASDYFHVGLGEVIRKTVPMAACFVVLMTGYYWLFSLI